MKRKERKTLHQLWAAMEAKAQAEAQRLHEQTNHEYRTKPYFNGVHVEGYSPLTNKWYTIVVVDKP